MAKENPSTPKTPVKTPMSPQKFVKPADLFKMRQRSSLPFQFGPQTPDSAQSPLKCLNHNESPAKKLPNIITNPFNRPVKRRLNLGANQGKLSPIKRSRMIELDEDANLEAPKVRATCYKNDWTLRTKVKIAFPSGCKNWTETSTTIHKRLSGSALVDESPSKLNDKTISLEAIKNVATVYQHPYMSWLPLYPRIDTEDHNKSSNNRLFAIGKGTQACEMMHRDWCESFDDLINLMLARRCPYFYMCSNYCNILFKSTPSSNPRRCHLQATITPFSYGMGCELNKLNIDFKCPELDKSQQKPLSRNNSSMSLAQKESSQASFGSQTMDSTSQGPSKSNGSNGSSQKQPTKASIETNDANDKEGAQFDSGNGSDLEAEFYEDDENDYFVGDNDEDDDDMSRVFESIGTSLLEFPELRCKRKGFVETDSCNNTQTKSSTSAKPLAIVEGSENVKRLVKFLKANRSYTTCSVGKFAFLPPTLLSPCEFRLSTPQYPEVSIGTDMIDERQLAKRDSKAQKIQPRSRLSVDSSSERQFDSPVRPDLKQQQITSAYSSNNDSSNSTQDRPIVQGPKFVYLRGTILPNLHNELHKILNQSQNDNHVCSSTDYTSSLALGSISFT